jgi:hypothetical protein
MPIDSTDLVSWEDWLAENTGFSRSYLRYLLRHREENGLIKAVVQPTPQVILLSRSGVNKWLSARRRQQFKHSHLKGQ